MELGTRTVGCPRGVFKRRLRCDHDRWYFRCVQLLVSFLKDFWIPGRLAFAISFHTLWNVVQYAVLGVATTTTAYGGHALVQFERTGSDVLLGTGRSIEGGLVAGGVLALAALVAFVLLARRGITLTSRLRRRCRGRDLLCWTV